MTAVSGASGVRATAGILLAPGAGAWAFIIWPVENMDQPLVRAMMLPSATPMVLTHRRLADRRGQSGDTRCLVAGYLAVWAAFSLATAAQWGLQGGGRLSGC